MSGAAKRTGRAAVEADAAHDLTRRQSKISRQQETTVNHPNAKLVTAICIATASMVSHAQPVQRLVPNVTIYGMVDTGVEYLSKTGPSGKSLVRMPNLSGSVPSRLGFRGVEDLGGGMHAQFVLESGFGIDTGSLNQGGRMFGRQAFVGIGGNWGTVSLGRQYDNFSLALNDYTVFGPNAYSLSSLESYIPAARFDNAIAYNGKFNNLTVAANYSFGRDTVPSATGTVCAGENSADAQACKAMSAMVKYVTPGWGVAAGYSQIKGAKGAAGGLVTSDKHDMRVTLNGFVKQGPFKVGGGMIYRDNDGNAVQPRSNIYFLEGAYAATPSVSLEAMVGRLSFKDSPTGDRSTLFAVRAVYSLSKRTSVYATAGRMNNRGALTTSVSSAASGSGAAVAGQGQTGVMLGMRASF
nr:porin [Diaphorobacter caeni]